VRAKGPSEIESVCAAAAREGDVPGRAAPALSPGIELLVLLRQVGGGGAAPSFRDVTASWQVSNRIASRTSLIEALAHVSRR